MMKIRFARTIVVFAIFCLATPIYAITPRLHVEGNKIKDPNSNTVVLRGIDLIDLGFLQDWQGGAIAMIDRITNKSDSQGNSPGWYPKVVRIMIAPPDAVDNWPHPFSPDNNDLYNLLRTVVNYCKTKDMYAIIDWHYVANTYDHVDSTSQFWTYMAPRFANDDHVMFELFNEPINDLNNDWIFNSRDINDWLSVRTDMQRWINIVRSYAPNNLILVAGSFYSQNIGPSAAYPLNGNNIVIVSHIYAGHWLDPYWTSSYQAQINTALTRYPVFMTEWGFSQSAWGASDGNITSYGQPLANFREARKISNSAWVASYDWGPPMFWTDWTLRIGEGEMGGFVKDTLYQKRNNDQPQSDNFTAPEAPAGVTALGGIEVIVLDWNGNTELDLAGYNIYRSTTSGSSYVKQNSLLLTSSDYTDANVSIGTTYYYVVTAVDTGGLESIYSGEVSAALASPAIGTGAILRQWWLDIPGYNVDDLFNNPNYPYNPSGRQLITKLQGPLNWADDYGTLFRGYLNPVTSGNYTFWIASDASSQLYLSTDANPYNIQLIGYVSDFTGSHEWDKYPEQQSSPISLVAGQKYFIIVLHKASTGNDNIAVAWQGPAISQQVLDGIYLSPCCLQFVDFAELAAQWNRTDCDSSNDWCSSGDFNRDGTVGIDDVASFVEGWLVSGLDF